MSAVKSALRGLKYFYYVSSEYSIRGASAQKQALQQVTGVARALAALSSGAQPQDYSDAYILCDGNDVAVRSRSDVRLKPFGEPDMRKIYALLMISEKILKLPGRENMDLMMKAVGMEPLNIELKKAFIAIPKHRHYQEFDLFRDWGKIGKLMDAIGAVVFKSIRNQKRRKSEIEKWKNDNSICYGSSASKDVQLEPKTTKLELHGADSEIMLKPEHDAQMLKLEIGDFSIESDGDMKALAEIRDAAEKVLGPEEVDVRLKA